jgi:hypothetical protein
VQANQVNLDGHNVLHKALANGHLILASWMLTQIITKKGALYSVEPQTVDKAGRTLVHYWVGIVLSSELRDLPEFCDPTLPPCFL